MKNNGSDNPGKSFDLEERTAIFGEAIIKLAKKVRVMPVTMRLIGQLVDAATSVGANYCEANDAEQEGLPPQDRDLQERIARVEALAPHDSLRGGGA